MKAIPFRMVFIMRDTMVTELPIGFAMALAIDEPAMKYFESLSPAKKESIIRQTHGVKSRQEIQQLVASIAAGDETC